MSEFAQRHEVIASLARGDGELRGHDPREDVADEA
jgi:hypothetical protein